MSTIELIITYHLDRHILKKHEKSGRFKFKGPSVSQGDFRGPYLSIQESSVQDSHRFGESVRELV